MASTATRTGRLTWLWGRCSQRLDFAPAVRLAVRADAVRLLRLVADRALVHARRLETMLRTPLVAARLRLSSFRDCHDRPPSIATVPVLPCLRLTPRRHGQRLTPDWSRRGVAISLSHAILHA